MNLPVFQIKLWRKSRHIAYQIHGFQNHAIYERITKTPTDLGRTYMMNAMWSKRMRFAYRVIKTKQRHWIVIYNNYCFRLCEI